MTDFKKLYFLTFVFILMGVTGLAQDHMYSQFFDAPVYLNPALNGQIEGDLRINMIYRSQWTSTSNKLAYYTAALSYKLPNSEGGLGLMFTRSAEGSAYLNKNNISGIYSYDVGSDDFILSFGVQGGITNRVVDWSKLIFDDQIDSRLGYIPGSVSSADMPSFNNKYYFDSGAGVNLVTGNFMLGTALHHLNQPDESFTGAPAKLPVRYTVHASYRINLDRYDDDDESAKSYIIPSVVIYKQSTAQSISAGMQYKHKGINFGAWYRNNNGIQGSGAFVLSAIFDLNMNRDSGDKLRVGVAHDTGIGSGGYSNSNGTTEGSLGYQTQLNSTGTHKYVNSNKCYSFY